jgi:hypothetical protein
MVKPKGKHICSQQWREHNKALYKYLYKEIKNDLNKSKEEAP